MKAFTFIHIKAHGFPFTRYITFANNIINPFTKSNKDKKISSNIRSIVFQAMHNLYIGYQQSYPIMCLTIQDSLTSLKSKMRLRSLQSFAFTRGLSAYKYKTSKIRKHKKEYENGNEYATLKINQIGRLNLEFWVAVPIAVSQLDED